MVKSSKNGLHQIVRTVNNMPHSPEDMVATPVEMPETWEKRWQGHLNDISCICCQRWKAFIASEITIAYNQGKEEERNKIRRYSERCKHCKDYIFEGEIISPSGLCRDCVGK